MKSSLSKGKVNCMQEKIRIQVIYKNRHYEYEDGFSAFLFEYAVLHKLDKKYGEKVIAKYIRLVQSCCHYDSNNTPIKDFANYVANHWATVSKYENYAEVLDEFYENKAEQS